MMIVDLHFSLNKPQTHLERAMEPSDFGDLILNHFCFNFGLLVAAAAVVFLGYQFALLRNRNIVSERVASDFTALAGQLDAAL